MEKIFVNREHAVEILSYVIATVCQDEKFIKVLGVIMKEFSKEDSASIVKEAADSSFHTLETVLLLNSEEIIAEHNRIIEKFEKL